MEGRHLEGKGSFDYDYLNDILFFKVEGREYDRSFEMSDYVIDIDNEDFIVGLQIFNASNHFNISKSNLKTIRNWRLNASIKDNVIEVKIVFNMNIRNKIIEKSPMIIERSRESLKDSRMIAQVAN